VLDLDGDLIMEPSDGETEQRRNRSPRNRTDSENDEDMAVDDEETELSWSFCS
jgi:hypothetical protein